MSKSPSWKALSPERIRLAGGGVGVAVGNGVLVGVGEAVGVEVGSGVAVLKMDKGMLYEQPAIISRIGMARKGLILSLIKVLYRIVRFVSIISENGNHECHEKFILTTNYTNNHGYE